MKSKNIFTERLLKIRKKLDLSQDELAKISKLQPSAISHFEHGTRKPSFDNLKRLADALEVTTDYLLGRTDDPQVIIEGDQLYRNYQNLTAKEREIAKDFMENLAKKSKDRRRTN